MIHDKFCLSAAEHCWCSFIAKVRADQDRISRADEREQAAQRLHDALWPHILTGMVSINAFRGARAAARGEDTGHDA